MKPLPREVEDAPKVAEKLAMLNREPCSKTSIYQASTTLAGEARSRDAIALLEGFGGHCPNAAGEIVYAGWKNRCNRERMDCLACPLSPVSTSCSTKRK
ncbi:MAG: hypothetical protein WAK01_05265 [Methylocystis sp.]